MKLKEAIQIGKKKGLNDTRDCVDEIVCNVNKYFNFISQNIEFELRELITEERKYLDGEIEI